MSQVRYAPTEYDPDDPMAMMPFEPEAFLTCGRCGGAGCIVIPGRWTLSNGDPGYPDEWDSCPNINVTGHDCPVLVGGEPCGENVWACLTADLKPGWQTTATCVEGHDFKVSRERDGGLYLEPKGSPAGVGVRPATAGPVAATDQRAPRERLHDQA